MWRRSEILIPSLLTIPTIPTIPHQGQRDDQQL